MAHEEFVNLSKEQKRNLPDPRDAFIRQEGRPTLVVRFSQAKYKTPKHGGLFGLSKNEKGKVPGGDENAFVVRDGLVALANSEDVKRYDNGMYQGGTERGYESVILYSPESNRLAVFKKGPDGELYPFITVCQPTPLERIFFEESNGNFVTQTNLKNPEILPILIKLPNPKQ